MKKVALSEFLQKPLETPLPFVATDGDKKVFIVISYSPKAEDDLATGKILTGYYEGKCYNCKKTTRVKEVSFIFNEKRMNGHLCHGCILVAAGGKRVPLVNY